MKALVISDIDDFHWKHGTGQADIVLSCGDVSDAVILEAAESFRCDKIFAVKGNHDSSAPFDKSIIDLHLNIQEFDTLKFGGFNGSWKYKSRGYFLYDQAEVEYLLEEFPAVDIFISHNSPRGIHDRDDEVHCGFDGLNSYISRTSPRFLFHGHQHTQKETRLGRTQVIGVYGYKIVEI